MPPSLAAAAFPVPMSDLAKQFAVGLLGAARARRIALPVLLVVAVMAPLAECAQVIVGAVLRLVVEMRDGENHDAAGDGDACCRCRRRRPVRQARPRSGSLLASGCAQR